MKDILKLVEESERQARENLSRSLIIHPGAIGDCLLTLPLAELLKKHVSPGGVGFIGNPSYIGFYPSRTAVDSIRAYDSVDFHRLFGPSAEFELEEKDPLLEVFSAYETVVSFLGQEGTDFEQNLIYTLNCVRRADLHIIPMRPDSPGLHVAQFYLEEYRRQSFRQLTGEIDFSQVFVRTTDTDRTCGMEILAAEAVDCSGKTALIAPGSGSVDKCWHLDNFLDIAACLRQEDWIVAFILGPVEMDRILHQNVEQMRKIGAVLCGLDLSEVLHVISASDLYIGNDSGPTHLAAMCGLASLAVFGRTEASLYRPLGPRTAVLDVGHDGMFRSDPAAVEKALKLCRNLTLH